ncbi:MAG: AAA family ATPase [Pseudomonadota bacterium]|nr:AAA family ATPase [Pseudomonadota bacterium]
MGVRNYLIEGVSGTGKTTVAKELLRRGYHVNDGDNELAYRGYPQTGEPLNKSDLVRAMENPEWGQKHWLWDIDKVKFMIANHATPISFFCGGSRNFPRFIDLFDGVFILEVSDLNLLLRRIDERVARDPTDWGAKPEEKELIARTHATKEDTPANGVVIDATAPLQQVVDEILSKCDPLAKVR